MSQALQPTDEALQARDRAWLLANREHLSLEKAAMYLVTRMRLRTVMGAVEFLTLCSLDERGRTAYEGRAALAYMVCDLYSTLFPREYDASGAAPFSTDREQQFYRLVNKRLFPLCITEDGRDTELEDLIEGDPLFFLPYVPLSATQQHDWINGCCGFEGVQTVFKVVLALIRHEGDRGWQALRSYFRLPRLPEPAPPLAAVCWSHFVYSCAVDGSPLRYLPLAFSMVCYKTGNLWLDVPPGHALGLPWSAENVARLLLARQQAEEINAQVWALNDWLDEDPAARIIRAVELWQKAAEMERRSGHEGMYVNERGILE